MDENKNKATTFAWQETALWLAQISQQRNLIAQPQKNRFIEHDAAGNIIYQFCPPFIQPLSASTSVAEYLEKIALPPGTQLILLIQAGAAALAIYQDGSIKHHKVINKYMIRKQRGKAQITYLRQKGKSRAGSRLRLRKSAEFVSEINARLHEWEQAISVANQLCYSCSVRLWRELFIAKNAPPVARDDSRWRKIPVDVRVPTFKELRHICYVLSHGKIEAPGESGQTDSEAADTGKPFVSWQGATNAP